MIKPFKLILILTLPILIAGCENFKRAQVETVQSFKIDSLDEVFSKDGVEFDREISVDGNGSIKISTNSPITVKLYQTGDIDFDESILIYSANLRTENLDGQAYIEMWCSFPEKGRYFYKAQISALSGTNNWKVQETPFFLKKGEIPDNVELNLVVNGSGTVWIDQINLLKRQLK
ncbi:MAG: hypothetical protein ACR2NC_02485 [Thermodesulfobacteriota bacterium]